MYRQIWAWSDQRVMCPCRRMRRCTSYLPCLSRSLCWSPTNCCLLRTRTTSRKDWQRSSRSSRTLCSPYRTWSPTTTSTPSRSKSKIWLAGQDQLRDSQVGPLKKWSIIFTLPSSCKYFRITFIQVRESFARNAGARSSWIFLAVNQSLRLWFHINVTWM